MPSMAAAKKRPSSRICRRYSSIEIDILHSFADVGSKIRAEGVLCHQIDGPTKGLLKHFTDKKEIIKRPGA